MLAVAYRAPQPTGRVPSTHKPCSECGRVLPRSTHYRLRYADDPYGIARGLTKKKRAAVLQAAAPNDRVLCVQPRCIQCDNLRRGRRRAVTELRRKLKPHSSAVVKHDSLFHTVEIRGRVPREVRELLLEPAARAGLVVVDKKGAPVLPREPEAALRVCYAGVLPIKVVKEGANRKIKPSRLGHFGGEQIAMLNAIPKLVANLPKSPLARLARDVIDVALVREWGEHSEEAMASILDRVRVRMWKFARKMIAAGLLDTEEAEARLLNGIYDGVRTWDPLHPSHAALVTHCGHRVKRSLQLRGRKDHRIAARKGSDGRFHGGAVSLDVLVPPTVADEGVFVPHAQSYSTGAGAVPRSSTERREGSRQLSVRSDVTTALSGLDEVDRRIAEGLFMSDVSTTRLAQELGMTVGDLRKRANAIRETLQAALAPYQQEVLS